MDIPEWRLPDHDVRSESARIERGGVGVNHSGGARVIHLSSGKNVAYHHRRGGLANFIEARLLLEAWVLDGVEPPADAPHGGGWVISSGKAGG
ncbi:hypothetical protein [Deinococcus wulumuqiensis]|uniref:Uncharacterized protein n=1 Tax=Deinococcus wulumuqiensis TaxID=980427 RepID=A0AAV4K6E4_9DEIO|nr:hypothetical protein [Deinococcus wulumuqiensis]QII20027.1 hypothetical protein G6R31_04075 [Deinococcus wulumuqiensis R12]GGI87069.1 hypothetical protein GCM10010914_21890 [Deinococcus wulumuqiensis]GGP29962.1 hypothetical protein GCM10008021_16130 [Deinococcus wulumuqiensis]